MAQTPRLSEQATKALQRTLLVVAVMLVSSYVLSNNLLGPLANFVKGPQGASLDRLSRAVHRWGSVRPVENFPLVVLVELGKPSIEALSPSGYVFNRLQMARITQKVLEYRPKGIFFDFDFSQPTNEGGVMSAGDRQLLAVMRQAQSPILLPDARFLGQPLEQIGPQLHRISAQVLYDGDGQTRKIPRPQSGQPVAASLGLYCLGLGQMPGEGCVSAVAGGNPKADGKRIVYRQVSRYGSNQNGQQLWPGLVVMDGTELLQGSLVNNPQTQGALFLVGRTYPEAADVHFTPIGAIQGIDIHVNALMTLATYRSFSETLGWGPVLLIVPLVVFFALWLTYTITDRWLRQSRYQGFVRALIETAIAAWLLFFAGIFILQYYGYFLDYLYPIVAFQMGSLLLALFAGGKKDESESDKGEAIGENLKEIAQGTGGDG